MVRAIKKLGDPELCEVSAEGDRRTAEPEGDHTVLLQYEYDHPDGSLATMRAKDDKSLILMQMKR